MKIGRGSRRSIRFSIFIGVLAGSVFSGSGAFAIDPAPISSQAELEAIGTNDETRAGSYFLDFAGTNLSLSAPTGSTYVTGIFTGTFDGNGKTLSGLLKPLFEQIGKSDDTAAVSDLTLSTAPGSGVTGRGVLANDVVNATIDNIDVTGTLTSNPNTDSGGLVGKSIDGTILNSSTDVAVIGWGENVGGGLSDVLKVQ